MWRRNRCGLGASLHFRLQHGAFLHFLRWRDGGVGERFASYNNMVVFDWRCELASSPAVMVREETQGDADAGANGCGDKCSLMYIQQPRQQRS